MKKRKWAVIGTLTILLHHSFLPAQTIYAETQTEPTETQISQSVNTVKQSSKSLVEATKSSENTEISSSIETSAVDRNSTSASSDETSIQAENDRQPVNSRAVPEASPKNGTGDSADNPIIVSDYLNATKPGEFYKLVAGGSIGDHVTNATITEMTGGTIVEVVGGTVTAMSGGEIQSVIFNSKIGRVTGGVINKFEDSTIDIIENGGQVGTVKNGIIKNLNVGSITIVTFGTLITAMNSGSLGTFAGGTIESMNGGSIVNLTGGKIRNLNGGLVEAMISPSEIDSMTGGILGIFNSGTINTMSGGSIVSMNSGLVKDLSNGFIYQNGGMIPSSVGSATVIKNSQIEDLLAAAGQTAPVTYDGNPQTPFSAIPDVWKDYVDFYYQRGSEAASVQQPRNAGVYNLSVKYHYPETAEFPGYEEDIANGETFTITPKQIGKINWEPASKEYDGTELTFTGRPANLISGDQVTVNHKSADKDTGSYTEEILAAETRLSGADSENYQVVPSYTHEAAGTITPRSITVNGLQTANKTYNGKTDAELLQPTNLTFDRQLSSEPLTLAIDKAKAAFTDKKVGTNKTVRVEGAVLDSTAPSFKTKNYKLTIGAVQGTINQKKVSITGVKAINRPVNDSLVVQLDDTNAKLIGVIEADKANVSYALGEGIIADKAIGQNKAVTTTIQLAGKEAENYQLVQPTDITVDILKQQLTITIHYPDGTTKIVRINEGEQLTELKDPTREGYKFAGWFLDEKLTEPFDSKQPIMQSLNLYPKWQAVTVPNQETETPTSPEAIKQVKTYPKYAKTYPKQVKAYPRAGEESTVLPIIAGMGIVGIVLIYLKKRKNKING